MELTKSVYRKTIIGKHQKDIEKQKIKLIEFRQKHNIKMGRYNIEKYKDRTRHCRRCNKLYQGSRYSKYCPNCYLLGGSARRKVKK
jgi:rubrerythrin